EAAGHHKQFSQQAQQPWQRAGGLKGDGCNQRDEVDDRRPGYSASGNFRIRHSIPPSTALSVSAVQVLAKSATLARSAASTSPRSRRPSMSSSASLPSIQSQYPVQKTMSRNSRQEAWHDEMKACSGDSAGGGAIWDSSHTPPIST